MYNFCDINIHVGDGESIGIAIVVIVVIAILFCVCIPLAIKAKSEKSNEVQDNNSITKQSIEDRTPSKNQWKCPNCGKINMNYVGTCGCGERKR